MSAVVAALGAMGGRRAVLLGDCVLDAYLYGETQRVSREAPVLVVRQERQEARLGGAANTAANLRALGVATTVVGPLGDDAAGAQVRHLLRATGCELTGVVDDRRPTAHKTRILAGAFGTTRQQVLRLDAGSDAPVDPAVQQDLLAALDAALGGADVLVVSDYGLGALTPALIAAVRAAARAGLPVCVDSRHNLLAYRGVTVVTPNTPEAEAAVGHAVDTDAAVQRAGAELCRRLELAACLITQGRHGMALCRPQRPPCAVAAVGALEVTDVTGAGDTVIATLAAAMAAGVGLDNAMRLANCAAGVVVAHRGAVVASPAEIAAAAAAGNVALAPWAAAC